ncbi:MAG TPA: hypothetical protein V6D21_15965 [Candidatus Obscuribacterales bacterium]
MFRKLILKAEKDGKSRMFRKFSQKAEKGGYNNNVYLRVLQMNIHEVVEFVDEVMYTQTGKHLNDLQRKVIEGILNRQPYDDIADTYGCSPGHAKDVGYELLQVLSKILNEPVNKYNLKSVLERQGSINFSFGDKSINSHIIGCVNFGSDQHNNTTPDQSQPKNSYSQDNKEQSKIKKLRKFGLSDEQIAEVLDLPLEVVNLVESEEVET